MSTTRTFDEINDKLKKGKAVVFTAQELVAFAAEQGEKAALDKVDVVTTATFGPMCSSGAFLNFGHSDPPIRMEALTLNNVPAYGGVASVDAYIGATAESSDRGAHYGGAHVIQDLIEGKSVRLCAKGTVTDCYPMAACDCEVSLDTMNQAYLYNPRNIYQNYAAAANASAKTLYTYMGTLLPNCGNVNYSTSGELSPLLKDPGLRTIGMGTRIFLGGGVGYVAWEGTQCVFNHEEFPGGGVRDSGATLALIGDLRGMSSRYIRGATFEKYGTTLYVGVGIPIPVLDEELLHDLARGNDQIFTRVFDYATQSRNRPNFGPVSYAQLRSGSMELGGKTVRTAPLSSISRACEIAETLREWLQKGQFPLQEPIAPIPRSSFKPLPAE